MEDNVLEEVMSIGIEKIVDSGDFSENDIKLLKSILAMI